MNFPPGFTNSFCSSSYWNIFFPYHFCHQRSYAYSLAAIELLLIDKKKLLYIESGHKLSGKAFSFPLMGWQESFWNWNHQLKKYFYDCFPTHLKHEYRLRDKYKSPETHKLVTSLWTFILGNKNVDTEYHHSGEFCGN